MSLLSFYSYWLFIFVSICFFDSTKCIDKNGYILYCPCMGRFGNQADHFLGVLAFAHALNRTLVLPPWVEYMPGISKSTQVPFKTYFKVKPLEEFHRVITMEDFIKELASVVWPPENRTALCYMARYNSDGCAPKEGSPFGPFWDTFSIDFVDSEFYGPLNYDVHHHGMGHKWKEKYTAEKWPVLAFTGAPASFPVQQENVKLQKFLVWSDEINKRAKAVISSFSKGPFIAIHLRNGIDWVRACKHIEDTPSLFAAPQCLGYRGEHGVATPELCLPSKDTILRQLKRIIKSTSASSVFVASDNDHMLPYLTKSLSNMKVSIHKMDKQDCHVELAVMQMANHFIGNCISSFTAFAKRSRDVLGLPSSYWAFPTQMKKPKHTEL